MTSSDPLHERMLALEMIVSHLQHDFEQMHSVILAQRGEIRALQALVERFEGELAEATKTPERRNLEEERPPHY